MTSTASDLCRSCGVCCNGTLFTHGDLESGDDPAVLREAGLTLLAGASRFALPCPRHVPEGCSVYAVRPAICRSYACGTLHALNAGGITADEASARIKAVHQALAALERVAPEGLLATRRKLSAAREGTGEPLPPLVMVHLGAVERVLDRYLRDQRQQVFSPTEPSPEAAMPGGD